MDHFDFKNIVDHLGESWNGRILPVACGETVAQVLLTRSDGDTKVTDLKSIVDNWRKQPETIKGVALMQSPSSFAALVNRHKSEHSAIFADELSAQPSLLAVIDYHRTNHTPQFARHRVAYKFPLSQDWLFWMSVNGKSLTQGDFAALIEDRIADLVSPESHENATASEMGVECGTPLAIINMSRKLQVNVSAVVKEAVTLQSGEGSIQFEETHTGADGKPLKVPGAFVIAVPVFHGAEATRIVARLRYRKAGQSLLWFVQLYRPDRILRDEVECVASDVEKATGLPLYYGSPEA